MGDREKKILGGLALAALVATGAGAAGVGPLASVMGAGEAGAAGAAGAGLTEAELLAMETGGEIAGSAGTLGGATQAQPALAALGEGAGAPLGAQTTTAAAAQPPIDLSRFLAKAGDKATDAAIMASIGQAIQPTVHSTAYGQTGFSPYQAMQPQGMRMTSPEDQLRRLGFS